jgi:hypothetical protein
VVQAVAYFECDVSQSEGVRAVFEECVELILALADHDQTRAHSGSRIGGKRTDDDEPTGCFPFLVRQTSGSPAARRRADTVRTTTQLSVDVKGVLAPVEGAEVSSRPSPTAKEWNARWLERERKRRRGQDACYYQSHQLADHRLGGETETHTDTKEDKGKEKVAQEEEVGRPERSERTRSREKRREESSTDEPSGGNVVRPPEPRLRKKRSLRRLLAAVSLRQLKPDPTPSVVSSAPPSLSVPPASPPGKKVGWTQVGDEAVRPGDTRLSSD